jgi:predicted O-methyltransferase YrrM
MDSRIEETRRAAKDVPGWLTDAEGELLFNLAKSCSGKGVIVEIGSWKGKSTIWMARGSQAGHGVKIYAIDPHEGDSGAHATRRTVDP